MILIELPENNELVIAKIRKIMPYGAFCVLPEYNDMEAFLHISEVSTGWVKNIHEFISEGQKHVVKVTRVDSHKNQVDISIRRVSDNEKKKKLEFIQREKRVENLLKLAIEGSKAKLGWEEVRNKIEEVYDDPYEALVEAMEKGEKAFEEIKLPKPLVKSLVSVAKKNIKKPTVTISGIISLTCYGSNGVDNLKKVLAVGEDNVKLSYLGAPRYKISLTASDYKAAEKKLSSVLKQIKGFAEKSDCEFGFEREKTS